HGPDGVPGPAQRGALLPHGCGGPRDLEVPERAQWIRMILVELNRLSSHFMFLGAFGVDVGVFATPFIYAWRERETIIDLLEEISGERVMYSYFRAGGLAWDVPLNFKQRVS